LDLYHRVNFNENNFLKNLGDIINPWAKDMKRELIGKKVEMTDV
jgi:hypothetical protein